MARHAVRRPAAATALGHAQVGPDRRRSLLAMTLAVVGIPVLLLDIGFGILGMLAPSGADLDTRVAAISASAGQTPLRVDEIPAEFAGAVVATEDERFFSHHGLDSVGIARSVWDDLNMGCLCEGGSTITQQLAKVVYFPGQSAAVRKLPGMSVALKLEDRYSKSHLLAAYLSVVATGYGLLGARAAACAYFSRSLRELSAAEAAEIAGMIAAPSVYDPRRNPVLAHSRRSYVLGRMVDRGLLTAAQARAADQSPLLLGGVRRAPASTGCAA
jgi:membrane peptidoglycan carboxypeptidase